MSSQSAASPPVPSSSMPAQHTSTASVGAQPAPSMSARYPNTAVSINGTLVALEQAVVPVFDRQFLYGDGIYETLRTYSGRLFGVGLHLNRLRASAESLELNMPWDDAELERDLQTTALATGVSETSVRLMVTRGEGLFGLDPALSSQSRRVVIARPCPTVPDALRQQGISVVIPETVRRNHPLAIPGSVKSGNYLNQIRALAEGKRQGADEVVLVDADDCVTEGSTSNVFWVRHGELFTPGLDLAVLPGITRGLVLHVARSLSIPVHIGTFPAHEFKASEEAFITSSLREILPIRSIMGANIGHEIPVPGLITTRLINGFHALVQAFLNGEVSDSMLIEMVGVD